MAKLILQVAYTTSNLEEREHLFKERGHEVISILGNSDALRRRDQFEHADVVVLGHAEDTNVRRKMCQWVKLNFPNVRTVAIGDGVLEADVSVEPDDRNALLKAIEP